MERHPCAFHRLWTCAWAALAADVYGTRHYGAMSLTSAFTYAAIPVVAGLLIGCWGYGSVRRSCAAQ